MSELHIQQYLRGGGSIDSLKERFGIGARRHANHENLVLFKYNQISSPFAEPLVRECRGIVLDEAQNWRVVARAFDKFFNYGEPNASDVDWTTARVQEKVDGSLCTLYHYQNQWHVATTGTPDARGDVNGSGVLFADLFWHTYRQYDAQVWPKSDAAGWCFLFELTGPANRVVVPHAQPSLTLLAARHTERGDWLHAYEAQTMLDMSTPCPVVREFPLQSIEDITASFTSMSPLTQEGYVIVDAGFNRIKVKHPGYVALHHAKDGMTTRAFVQIARSGEKPEVLVAFPELRPLLDDASANLSSLVSRVEAEYESLRAIETQKDFALRAVKTNCSAALFALRTGKVGSVREWFATAPLDNVVRMLGYKTDAPAARST